MTPQTELRQFFENIAATTAEIFLEQGELFPRAILLAPAQASQTPDAENGVALILLPLGQLDKGLWTKAIKAAIEKTKAIMIVFASEAWVLSVKGKSKAEFDKLVQDGISQLPERQECLQFTAEDRHGNTLIASQPITRDADGKPSLGKLGPMVPGDGPERYEGRFASFMPPVGKAH